MEKNPAIKQILIETEAANVDRVYFDEESQLWVVTYKMKLGLEPDEFESFSQVLEFLYNG